MSEEKRAQALAWWLAQPPGTPPPDELDPDVVASIYALRPERAPDPAVSADEILAGLTTGPLAGAGPSSGAVAEEDAAGGSARIEGPVELVVIPGEGASSKGGGASDDGADDVRHSPRKVFAAVLALAASLFLVVRSAPVLNQADEVRGEAVAGAAAGEVLPQEAELDAVADLEELDGLEDGDAWDEGALGSGGVGVGGGGSYAPPPPQPLRTRSAASPPQDAIPEASAYPSAAAGAVASAPPARPARDQDQAAPPEARERKPRPTPMAAPAQEPALDAVAAGARAEAEAWAAADRAREQAQEERKLPQERAAEEYQRKLEMRRAADEIAEWSVGVAEPPASASAPKATAGDGWGKPAGSSGRARRGRAEKRDAPPRLAVPEVEAEEEDSSGANQAIDLREQAVPNDLDTVGPDSPLLRAATQAKAHLRVGELDLALQVLDLALKEDPEPSAARSWLLVVRGDVLLATGDRLKAEQAWREAAVLNATRAAAQ